MTALVDDPAKHKVPMPPPVRLTRIERERLHADSLLLPRDGQSALDREPVRVNPRLAIYLRRSLKTDTGASLGRQRRTLEKWVTELGGRYDAEADVFFDDDRSAKGGTYRPDIERLLRLVVAGHYDGVLVWDISRWTRNPREGRIAGDLMRQAGCEFYSLEERFISLFGPWAAMYDYAISLAAKEAQRISARIADWHRDIAKTGHHRAAAPFGMVEEDRPSPLSDRAAPIQVLVPDVAPRDELGGKSRAELLRDAVDQVLDGESLRSIAFAWNSDGLPSTRGGYWSGRHLSALLRNPQLAGYAVHKGVIVEDEAGQPIAPHVPLLEPERWHRLMAEMGSRTTTRRSTSDAPLRGLMRCATCSGTMVRVGGGTKRSYSCSARVTKGATACSGTSIIEHRSNAAVWAAVIEMLTDPQRRSAALSARPAERRATEKLDARVSELRSRLARLERMKLAGDYDDADGERRYAERRGELTGPLSKALDDQANREARRPRRALGLLRPELPLEQAIAALSDEQRRSLLLDLIERVEVAPKTGGRFDPTRLHIVWRTDRP